MRSHAPRTISLLFRLAIATAVILILVSTQASTLLWRNALVLIPLTLVVALACRWLPCRPITRHTMWLALLIWPLAGTLLPPIQFGSGDQSAATTNAEPSSTPDASSFGPEDRRMAGVLTERPARDHRVRERGGRFSLKEATAALGASREESLEPADERRFIEPVKIEAAQGGPRLLDVEILSVRSDSLTSKEHISGHGSAKSDPTPPLTVARTQGPAPSRLSTVTPWVGQLSQLVRSTYRAIGDGIRELNERLALLDPVKSVAEDPVLADAGWILDLTSTNRRDSLIPQRVDSSAPLAEQASASPAAIPEETASISTDDLQAVSPPAIASAPEAQPREWNSAISEGWNTWVMPRLRPWIGAISDVREAIVSIPAMPVSIWVAGIGLILIWRAARARRFHALIERARRAPIAIRSQVADAAREIGLREVPRVVLSSDRVSPLIWFDGQLTLVLPESLWEELDEPGRRAVLFHELAHLRRRDHWVSRIESWIGAIYWWHPVVWWIRTRLQDEAENCCDAWVTWLQPGGRRAYAEALIRTNQFVSGPTVAVPASAIRMTTGRTRRFARRLTMVMTQRVAPSFSGSTFALAVGILAAGWLATPAQSCEPDKNKPTKEGKSPVYSTVAPPATPSAPVWTTTSEPSALSPALPAPIVEGQLSASAAPSGFAPMAAMPPLVVGEVLPTLAFLTGEPGSDDDDDDSRLEKRVRRLEERLERIAELLERQHSGGGKAASPRGRVEVRPAAPAQPARPARPATPRVEARGRTGAGPGHAPGFAAQFERGEVYAQIYRIPEGRCESLLKLMVRSDIPPRVRGIQDGKSYSGIEFNGNAQQHAAFGAFVDMISGEMEEVGTYHLPKGKLDAMTEFMARGDVPIWIEPNDENLRVRGPSPVQRVMSDFINLIHPDGSAMAPAAVEAYVAAADAGRAERRAAEGAYKQAAEEMKVAMARKHAKQDQRRAEIDQLFAKAREMQKKAAQMEAEADQLSDQADQLFDRMAEIADALDGAAGDKQKVMKKELADLERQAREMERKAKSLFEKASELELRGDESEEHAEALQESIEAEHERDREHAHEHAKTHGAR